MGDAPSRLTSALHECAADLLRYFLRRLEREDAADAVAEVMTIAWTRVDALPTASGEARLWLFGIARNVLLHARRGSVRRSRLADRLRVNLTAGSAAAADRGLEIRDAIDRLDDDLAEVVRLVHWDGFTLSEAATLLDIPASTVRSRYQRARRALHAALAPVAD